MERIDVCVEADGAGVVRVRLAGDVDCATADTVFHALTDALTPDGPTRMDVDLSRVRVLDAAGIGVLLAARNRAVSHGIAFRVSGAVGMPRQALEMTGVLALFGDRE